MKHLLLLIASCLMIPVFGQRYLSFEPSVIDERLAVDLEDLNADQELKARITNVSGQTLLLKWKRMIINQPLGWQTQICDDYAYYTPDISTNYDAKYKLNSPIELAPGASFDFSLHILPSGIAGKGLYEIPFSLTKSPDKIIGTLVLSATVEDIADAKETAKTNLRIFPNPAIDYFEVTPSASIDRVEVFNMIGRKVRSFDTNNTYRFDISDLPAGIYFVSLISDKKGVLKTLRLNKRVFRP